MAGRTLQSRPGVSCKDQEVCNFLRRTRVPREASSYFTLSGTKPEQHFLDLKFTLLWAESWTRWPVEVPSTLKCLLRLRSPCVPAEHPEGRGGEGRVSSLQIKTQNRNQTSVGHGKHSLGSIHSRRETLHSSLPQLSFYPVFNWSLHLEQEGENMLRTVKT